MHSLEYSSVYPLCHIILSLDCWVHMWPCLQFSLDNSAAGPPDMGQISGVQDHENICQSLNWAKRRPNWAQMCLLCVSHTNELKLQMTILEIFL